MHEQNVLTVRSVDFMGDSLVAVQSPDGIVYASVRHLCCGIGLRDGQIAAERHRVQTDSVLSGATKVFSVATSGGPQSIICIQLDFLPLWLAKISITPKMREETPELADRLLQYQLNAKEVLAAAFLPKYYGKETVSPRMTDLEVATLISRTPSTRMGVLLDFLKSSGYDVPDVQSDGIHDSESGSVKQFFFEFYERFVWGVLPYGFLFDLYKAWLEEKYPNCVPLGRNKFQAALREVVNSEPELRAKWCSQHGPIHPGWRMDACEPLIAIYGLKNWKGRAVKSSYKGLVRI